MVDRLDYQGSTGGPSAWLWGDDMKTYQDMQKLMCVAAVKTGFLEPLDANGTLP
jgi:hypothetical protein